MKLCGIENCNNILYCKALCRKHYNKQYRRANLEESKLYNNLYKKNNRANAQIYEKQYSSTNNGRFNKAKCKAKIRVLDFTLTLEQFIEISSKPCYYCNDELCGKEDFQGAHLDRIDNSKGYITDNVLSCGILCNRIRMDNLTVEETKDAVDGILAGRKKRQRDNINENSS